MKNVSCMNHWSYVSLPSKRAEGTSMQCSVTAEDSQGIDYKTIPLSL